MYSSWWCASSSASLQSCNLASVWFYHRWRVFKKEMPLPFAFSSFFFHWWFCMEYLLWFLWHDFSGRKCVFLWSCLLFKYALFFLSHSLLWHGLSTAFIDSPLTQISPLSSGLQNQSSSQVVLSVLEDFSCFPLSSLRDFLQPPVILFDQVSEAWAISQGSVIRVDIRDRSGPWICMYKWLQTILLPFSRTVLQLLFSFALKRTAQRTSLEKKMRVATPVSSEYCEIILKNHPVDPVSLDTYVSNKFCPNRFRFIGKPL